MQLHPLHDRVVVKRLEEEHMTTGGIVIPDAAMEKSTQGEVIAFGNGRVMSNGKVRPLDVKPGDWVLFEKYAGQTVKIADEELLVLREEDIIAIVEERAASKRNIA